MKTTNSIKTKKLSLARETVRDLSADHLQQVAGGVYDRKQGATRLCDPTG